MLTSRQLTRLHRQRQLALRAVTVRDAARLWPLLSWADLDGTFPRFAAAAALLVGRNRSISAGLGAEYLRVFRIAAGLPGDIPVITPELNPEALATSLAVASKVAAKKSASNGVDGAAAMTAALSLTSGTIVRHVLDGGRSTLTATVARDPRAGGWRRVLGGGGCDFCRGLAGQTVDADFQAHDNCGCTAEPVY